MNKRSVFCLLVTLVLVLSCGPLGPSPEAKSVADRYFELRKAGQTQELLSLYGEDFFQVTPRDKLVDYLEKTAAKLGPLQSYELSNSHKVSFAGTSNSGTTTTLIYAAKYTNGPAVETLVLFEPASGGPPRIKGHNIQSEAFLR